MRLRPPTEAELVASFNRVLDGIVAGVWGRCPSDTGLDDETIDILNLLAEQPDPKTPADIAACRTEFGRMLDGTHAIEAQQREDEEWANLLTGQ